MALKVKDPSAASTKWANRAGAAQPDYQTGVMNTTGQAQAAVSAADTWQQSVAAASAKTQFIKNLQAAGDAAWQAGVKNKGAARYAQGVSVAKDKYAAKVTPYFAALASLNLPPRGLRRSAQNYARVQAVGTALAAVKTGGAA